MRNYWFLLAMLAFCYPSSFAQYSGRVFVDSNENGVYDSGEKLLENIAVSDGLHVLLTDKQGRFVLPGHDREKFVFVTTPSGYRTVGNHYHRIGGKDKEYNFPLRTWKQGIKKDGAHSFIQVTDTEIFNTEGHEDWVDNVRKYMANEQTSFLVHTGDICYEEGLKAHIRLMNSENMGCPVYYGIGNHDLVAGAYGEELFESLYGPVYYSFDVGNTHYLMTPMPYGDHRPSYIMEEVVAWIKNDLEKVNPDKSIIVFNHDLLPFDKLSLDNHNLKAWLYGHWHINYMMKIGEVVTVGTGTLDKGGIDHSTSAYRVLSVDGKGNITSDLRYTYMPAFVQIASVQQDYVPVYSNGDFPVTINTYSSVSAVDKVEYTLFEQQKIVKKGKLNAYTDWSWNQTISGKGLKDGQLYVLYVKAFLSDGTSVDTRKAIVYRRNNPDKVELTQDWTNLLGNPQHVGFSPDTLQTNLQLAWIQNVGANIFMSSPLVYQGHVFVATVDENLKGEGGVTSLDGESGSIRWKFTTRNSVKNSIAIEDGIVFAQDAEGYLYAIDAYSGKLFWEKKLDVSNLPALIEGLVTAEGVVYAGTGNGLSAINCKTGDVLWVNKDWRQREGTTTTISVGKDVIISGAQWGGLYANDIRTGKLLWSRNKNGLSNRGSSAAVHSNLVYITSQASLFVLDASTGRIIVRKELPVSVDVTSTPLLTDKQIIFGTANEGVMALDAETLETIWQFKTEPALVYTAPYTRHPVATVETSPVGRGNIIFFGASDGMLYGIESTTGNCIWKHELGAPCFATVAVSGNTLIAVDFGGNVYAFTSGK